MHTNTHTAHLPDIIEVQLWVFKKRVFTNGVHVVLATALKLY